MSAVGYTEPWTDRSTQETKQTHHVYMCLFVNWHPVMVVYLTNDAWSLSICFGYVHMIWSK